MIKSKNVWLHQKTVHVLEFVSYSYETRWCVSYGVDGFFKLGKDFIHGKLELGVTRMMDIQPVSALKSRMPAVLKGIKESRNPILVVSNGRPQAVLQDVFSYQATQDAIVLLKLMLHSECSVTAKHGASTKAVQTRLRARLAARGMAQ